MTRFLSFNKNGKTIIVVFLVLFLIVSTALVVFGSKKYPLFLNGENYFCSTLSKEDEKALKINRDLIASLQKTQDDSAKRYDEKINNCGTEKEYQLSPESQKKWNEIVPANIQTLLNEYEKTKPYTIKDFQECKRFWEEVKKKSSNEFIVEIKKWEDYEVNLLTKNKCIVSRK